MRIFTTVVTATVSSPALAQAHSGASWASSVFVIMCIVVVLVVLHRMISEAAKDSVHLERKNGMPASDERSAGPGMKDAMIDTTADIIRAKRRVQSSWSDFMAKAKDRADRTD